VYGFYHNRTLYDQAQKRKLTSEWERKEKLIAQAKQEYAKLNNKGKSTSSEVVTDINDANFDVEKYLDYQLKQLQ
jgi:F-type H+-transporting ATP synthase subunit e